MTRTHHSSSRWAGISISPFATMTNLNTLRLAHVQAHDFEAERTCIDPLDRRGRETERGGGNTGQRNGTRQDRTVTLGCMSCYSGIPRPGPLPLLPFFYRDTAIALHHFDSKFNWDPLWRDNAISHLDNFIATGPFHPTGVYVCASWETRVWRAEPKGCNTFVRACASSDATLRRAAATHLQISYRAYCNVSNR